MNNKKKRTMIELLDAYLEHLLDTWHPKSSRSREDRIKDIKGVKRVYKDCQIPLEKRVLVAQSVHPLDINSLFFSPVNKSMNF